MSCVNLANNHTTKGIRHIELRKTRVREWVQQQTLRDLHVAGKCNPSDIFTKEMKGGAHFRRLRDSFMVTASKFKQSSLSAMYRRRVASAATVTSIFF